MVAVSSSPAARVGARSDCATAMSRLKRLATLTSHAWRSDSSPAREARMTTKHAPVYLVVVGITYGAEWALNRIGYTPPDPLSFWLRITPGLLIIFMPLTPFLYFVVGSYYDLREYIDQRQQRRHVLRDQEEHESRHRQDQNDGL
jgi:hypothetical protein